MHDFAWPARLRKREIKKWARYEHRYFSMKTERTEIRKQRREAMHRPRRVCYNIAPMKHVVVERLAAASERQWLKTFREFQRAAHSDAE